MYMDDKIEQYIVDIVFATHFPEEYHLDHLKEMISCNCGSPRASINLAWLHVPMLLLNAVDM